MEKANAKGKVNNPNNPPSRVSSRIGGGVEESKVDQSDSERGFANAGSGAIPPLIPPVIDQDVSILLTSQNPPASSNPPQEEEVWEPGQYRRPHSKQEIEAMSDAICTRLFDLMEANAFKETFEQDFGDAEQDWYEYVLASQYEELKPIFILSILS